MMLKTKHRGKGTGAHQGPGWSGDRMRHHGVIMSANKKDHCVCWGLWEGAWEVHGYCEGSEG